MGFLAVQKLWKSVMIWQSYRMFKGGNFFWDTVYKYWALKIHVTVYVGSMVHE